MSVSKRVNDTGTISGAFDEAGLVVGESVTGDELRGFIPAKCTVILPNNANSDPNAVSKLTGIKYNKKGASSYTFPYGQKTGTTREAEVRAAIEAAITVAGADFQFKSERL